MSHIIIASQNPVKIQAVQDGFTRMLPDQKFTYEGVSVPSGVADQPMTDQETYQGAQNRVQNAMDTHPGADFYVGIEGGVGIEGDQMSSFAWVVIRSGDLVGKSRTATFYLPPAVMKLIKEGKELGDADDIVFGKTNSKQANGSVGLLTRDVVTRASYYTEAVILALVVFKNEQLYE